MLRELIIATAIFALPHSLEAQSPLLNVPTKRAARITVRNDTVFVVTSRGEEVIGARSMISPESLKSRIASAQQEDPEGIWVGVPIAYNFATSGDAAEKLSVAAQIVLNSWEPGWNVFGGTFRVPIVGNVAKPLSGQETAEQLKDKAEQLTTSSEGIYAGISPYIRRDIGPNGYSIRLFSTLAVRTNGLKDLKTDSTFFLSQGRFSVGLLFGLGQFKVGTGAFSIETTHLRFKAEDYERAFGERRPALTSTDLVLVLPIATNVGILAQYVINHTKGDNVWRAGVALKPASQ
jgi:hypothetical protein